MVPSLFLGFGIYSKLEIKLAGVVYDGFVVSVESS